MKCHCPKDFVWYKTGKPVTFCSKKCEDRAYKNADLPRPHSHWCPLCETEYDCLDESCPLGDWSRRGRMPSLPTDRPCDCCEDDLEESKEWEEQECEDNSDFLYRAEELGYVE